MLGKNRKAEKIFSRPEVIVFAVIVIVVLALSLFVSVPQIMQSGLPNLGKAPELTGTQEWVNSGPLTLAGLKGKVVLIDFWTYSCINCIRTMPYLNAWHEKYADKGLVIIGVHTPEFEFEKNIDNVRAAVAKYDVKHPVVQDNNFETWRAYKNNYWPRKYLIDAEGNIRYDHIGEGGYEETEKAIQLLLAEAGIGVNMNITDAEEAELRIGTPELYLGYSFARAPLGNKEGFSPETIVNYEEPVVSSPNTVYLSGIWHNGAETITSINDSKLYLIYRAKDVNIVAGGSAVIAIKLDGQPLAPDYYGSDVSGGHVAIDGQRLYNIISAPGSGVHTLQLDVSPGMELYTFTFG